MQSWLMVKSGKQNRGKRGRGSGSAAGFSGQVGSTSRGPAGATAPLACSSSSKQVPQPLGRLGCRPRPQPLLSSPAPCPAARLTFAKLPARERKAHGLRRGRSSPEPLSTHAAAAAAAAAALPPRTALLLQSPQPHGRPPDPRAPGKSLHRRAAPPLRTGQRRAAPTRARAGPQLRRPDSGAVAITATTLGPRRGDTALKPPLQPGEPWRTSTQQQAGLG